MINLETLKKEYSTYDTKTENKCKKENLYDYFDDPTNILEVRSYFEEMDDYWCDCEELFNLKIEDLDICFLSKEIEEDENFLVCLLLKNKKLVAIGYTQD